MESDPETAKGTEGATATGSEQGGDEQSSHEKGSDEPSASKANRPAARYNRWALVAIAAALVLAGVGLWRMLSRGGEDDIKRATQEVALGMAASSDAHAIEHFEKAIDLHPPHYGANYQLARALDKAGRADEAKPLWEKVLTMAQQYDDEKTASQARTRLGQAAPEKAVADPMAAGLAALQRGDARAAVKFFRQQLAKDPSHYGATYQLATALERSGDPKAAHQTWTAMLPMAEAIGDAKTAGHARARIAALRPPAAPEPADPQRASMQAGLDALHTKRDPVAAVELFRKVLAANPTHYGATYQLAAALQQAGKSDEARKQWARVATMADAIGDAQTANHARRQLAAPTTRAKPMPVPPR